MKTEKQIKSVNDKIKIIESYLSIADKGTQFGSACSIALDALCDVKILNSELNWTSAKDKMPEARHVALKTQFLTLGYFQVEDLKGDDYFEVSRLNSFQYEFNKWVLFESRSNFIVTHWKEIQEPIKE